MHKLSTSITVPEKNAQMNFLSIDQSKTLINVLVSCATYWRVITIKQIFFSIRKLNKQM